MPRWSRLAALMLAGLLSASLAQSATFRPLSLQGMLHASGTYTIPDEWAGVWQTVDSTYSCTPRLLETTDTFLDTLCRGTSAEPDTAEGFDYNCTGTVTPTSINLTCTGSFTFEGCTATFTVTTTGTRSGDTAITNTRFTTTFTPSLCAFQPDTCKDIVQYTTRLGPEPPTCTTSTLKGTWGELKTRYR